VLTIEDARAVASNLAQLHELIVDAWHRVVPKKVSAASAG
jgi:alkylated DNA nucleotide flippase Atl1